MKLVKVVKEYKIFERRDGRFAVKTRKGKAVNAEEKTAILLSEGLVTAPEPKPEPAPEPEVEAVEEAPAEEAPAAEEEPAAEEAPAEEAAPEEEPAAAEEELSLIHI